MSSDPTPTAVPRRMMIIFGILSVFTLTGPLAIIFVGRGGDHSTWPPDRPIEWIVFVGVTITYTILLGWTLFESRQSLRRLNKASQSEEGR